MEEYKTVKVSSYIKKALKIKSAKEDTTIRNLTDKIIKEKLIEDGDLLDEEERTISKRESY